MEASDQFHHAALYVRLLPPVVPSNPVGCYPALSASANGRLGAYILTVGILAFPVIYPYGNLSAIDTYYFGVSASTSSGLNP